MVRVCRSFLAQKVILTISLLSLVASAHSSPLSEKNILFYAPFDGSFDAKMAHGQGSTTSSTQAKLVDGLFGQGALVGNPGSAIRYASNGNFNLDSGTVSMWVKPVGWGKGDTYTRFFFSLHGFNEGGQSGRGNAGVETDTDFAWLYKFFIYSVTWLSKQSSPQIEYYYIRTASGDSGGVLKYDWETDRWAHVLATWSGSQLALYVDGKFAGSEYVPSRNIIRQSVKEFSIGGQNQRDKGIADTIIDDVLILDRPVTPSEAEAIYKKGIAALCDGNTSLSTPAFEVKSRYDLSSNKIVMTSELIGLSTDELKTLSISYLVEELQTGKKVVSGRVAVKELLQNTPIDTKSLPTGKYRVIAKLRDSDNAVTSSTSEFERFLKPEWLGNTLGRVKTPPKPWLPVSKKDNSISCWEREYTWNKSAFPSSITAKGTELLNRPITLNAKINSKAYQLNKISLRWDKVSPVRADFTVKGMLADIPVQVQGYLEFDGFSWYKINIDGKKLAGRKLEFLSLDIPMQRDVATLMYTYDPTWVMPGAVRPINMELKYYPNIWLGNEKVGLQWSTDNFKDWNLIDSTKMASIHTDPKETLLRLVMVDHSIKVDSPLTYTAGLQATPVKPMPDDIRTWDMAIGTYKSNPPVVENTILGLWSQWNRTEKMKVGNGPYGYMVASRYTFSDLKDFQAAGITPFIYWNTGMLWSGDPVLKVFGDWGKYKEDAYWANSLITDNNNSAMQDYMVWSSWKLFKDNPGLVSSVCGYYLDSTAARWQNGMYTIIGTRELQMRSYLAMKNDSPEIRYMNHQSGQPNMTQLAFSDFMLTGEHLCKPQMATELNYYNILTLDGMRAEYLGEKFGIPHVFLPNIARSVESDKKKFDKVYSTEGIPAAEHVIGMTWIHDIPVYHAYMHLGTIDQSYRTKKAFGWDKDTKFIGYWENGNLVQVSSDKQPVVVSVYKRPDKVLFVIMNNSDSDAAVTLKPDWSKLGIAVPANMVDGYREQAIPSPEPSSVLLPVTNGTVTFTVKARNFKALVAR